jgi:hypothetical protein
VSYQAAIQVKGQRVRIRTETTLQVLGKRRTKKGVREGREGEFRDAKNRQREQYRS